MAESKNQEMLEGLKTAMEAELTGHNFYKSAVKSVSDPRAKEALSEMAEDEMNHFQYLRHQYMSVLEKGDYDFTRKLLKDSQQRKENPIFSDAIKKRVKDSHYEVSVLTIGMKLELDAIHYYRGCAKKAGKEEAKRFFNELADWETSHYEAFEQALDSLKEEYWEANDFIPVI